ncbi:NAD(P)-binding domain-containing protein [Salininema proteolyticum]|uniref:NAD(P)-binding domain-containing protein n=1 Tax=Salininema proteolyticum TaxID=1607685 RepID=A0ABV8TVA8_9ACTN
MDDLSSTARLSRYFTRVADAVKPDGKASTVLITHLLPQSPVFIAAMTELAPIAAILPKPKSVDPATLSNVAVAHTVDELDRATLSDPNGALDYLEHRAGGQDIVLADIGGYFAPTLAHLCREFSGRILGVVEDTENGYRRYRDLAETPCPIVSVARSPLKQPEDYLVGQSCAFSAEALMRSVGDIPIGRPVAVIGFGKIGRAAAATLRAKGSVVRVFDTDPVRQARALSIGYTVARTCQEAIAGAGLVLCATGNRSLRFDEFSRLPNGAHVATVTSSDDELDLTGLADYYTVNPIAEHVSRWEIPGHYFHIHNAGNAVNFIHGAVVGAFIHLVQAEILAATAGLIDGHYELGHHEVSDEIRRQIASFWLDYFRENA